MSKVSFNDLPAMNHQYNDEEITRSCPSMEKAEAQARADTVKESDILSYVIVAIMIMVPLAICGVIYMVITKR